MVIELTIICFILKSSAYAGDTNEIIDARNI